MDKLYYGLEIMEDRTLHIDNIAIPDGIFTVAGKGTARSLTAIWIEDYLDFGVKIFLDDFLLLDGEKI